jgi:hypothetical protein
MPEIGKMVMYDYMIGELSKNIEGPQGQIMNTRYYILGDADPLFEANLGNGLGSLLLVAHGGKIPKLLT